MLTPVLMSTNINEITNRIHVLTRVMRYYKRGQYLEDEHIPVQQGMHMRLLRQPLRFRSCPPGGASWRPLAALCWPSWGASRGPPRGPLACPPGLPSWGPPGGPPGGLLGGLLGPQSSLGVLTCGGKNEMEV